MMKPTVWVIKEQMRRTDVGSEVMDFTPALPYGDIKFICRTDMPLNPGSPALSGWWAAIDKFVDAYDGSRDFIIATGKPSDIFTIGWALGTCNKKPQYLMWKREENRYRVMDPFISAGALEF